MDPGSTVHQEKARVVAVLRQVIADGARCYGTHVLLPKTREGGTLSRERRGLTEGEWEGRRQKIVEYVGDGDVALKAQDMSCRRWQG